MKGEPVVALLPWGDVIEDFLDALGITVEKFCTVQTGGWLFGYIHALRTAGIRTHLICVSSRVSTRVEYHHQPTGARVTVLPATRGYRWLRKRSDNEFSKGETKRRIRQWYRWGIREILPYLATPLRPLVKELRSGGASAILCQEYEYARFDVCVLVGRLLRLPVYATFQGGNSHFGPIQDLVRPWSIRRADGLLIGSRVEEERVRTTYGVGPPKTARIFNPLDLAQWHARDRASRRSQLEIQDDTVVTVWHGRVDMHQKGLDILLDAWQIMERGEEAENRRLFLVGAGLDGPALREGIAQRELRRVVWLENYFIDSEQVRSYLAAADIAVLPSNYEGFPVAPLEAMACGLPLVATDVSGIRDILEHGERSGGIVVPRRDPEALARALSRLCHDPLLRRNMGSCARQRVETVLSFEKVGSQLRSFFGV